MERQPPTPVSKSFLVCKQVVLDTYSQEHILLGPMHALSSWSFPFIASLSIFAHWTSVQGSYRLEVQLQDLEGNVDWRAAQEIPLESQDPLLVTVLALRDLRIVFPRPGKYDLVMLANAQEVARSPFWAVLPTPPTSSPG